MKPTLPTILAILFLSAIAEAQNASGMMHPVACPCIKNTDDKCMTLGKGIYPWRQFDEYISGPHCVTGCYPGYSDVYGYSEQTKKELAECRIDWKRLRHDLSRDNFPEWQW
jgi:hypothetical protein